MATAEKRSPSVIQRLATAWRLLRVLTDPMILQGFGGSPYKGAEQGRISPFRNSRMMRSDEEILLSARTLRSNARSLVRNTGPGARFTHRMKTQVVGEEGFICSPQNRDPRDGKLLKDLNRRLADGWYEFSEDFVTADGRLDGVDLEQLMAATWGTDGETILRKRWNYPNKWGLALEPIDADLLDETYSIDRGTGRNEVRLGVEVDGFGRPQAYHVLQDEHALGLRYRRVVYPAADIIHVFVPFRVNQVRGITPFAPAMVSMGHLAVYIENELVASSAGAACMAFFLQGGGETGSIVRPPSVKQPGQAQAGFQVDLQPATARVLPPGITDIKSWDPQHPVDAFPYFLKAIMREGASALDQNYNSFANDAEGVSFSQGRLAVEDERDSYRRIQRWFGRRQIQPIYEAWLEAAVLKGVVKLPTGYDWRPLTKCYWRGRRWKYVDHLKDIQAKLLELKAGLTTPQRIASEQGMDLEEIYEEIRIAMDMAKEKGIPIDFLAGPSKSATPRPDDESDPDDPDDDTEKDSPRAGSNGHGKRPPRFAVGTGG